MFEICPVENQNLETFSTIFHKRDLKQDYLDSNQSLTDSSQQPVLILTLSLQHMAKALLSTLNVIEGYCY